MKILYRWKIFYLFLGEFLLPQAIAMKFSYSYGFFSLTAKASKSVSVSSPSASNIMVTQPFKEKAQLFLSYTLNSSGIGYTGDLEYGLDVGVHYFPWTNAEDNTITSDGVSVSTRTDVKSYVGLGMAQRQFQSVRNSFSGLGFHFGQERYWKENVDWKIEIRYYQLNGSSQSTATEMNLLAGLVFKI